MLLRNFKLENVRSFLESAEFKVEGQVAIIVGPNGGGKTNLLDAIVIMLRKHIFASMYVVASPTPEHPNRHIIQPNDQLNNMQMERHSKSQTSKRQYIEIELEVTERDVQSMNAMKNDMQGIGIKAANKYHGYDFNQCLGWTLNGIEKGAKFTYTLENSSLAVVEKVGAHEFLRYLQLYEIDGRLREEYGYAPLAWPMIYLPVNRTAHGFATGVQIHSFNESEQKRSVDATSSRTASSIVNLAVGRIAEKYHMLLSKDDGAARKTFREDANLKELTKSLNDLGYEWELVSVSFKMSQYNLQLKKQGATFRVDAASSGEKELLTYLLAIYALNVRDALIVVDEPELHLHPKWQKILLQVFEKLAKETGNQFIFATHSPTFITPSSIQYVSRVFSQNQMSQIHALDTENLPDAKQLLNIVNSQNNEKLFFSDRVVLVEGVSDRILFETLFEKFGSGDASGTTLEVIDIGGKGFFKSYAKLLKACNVPFSIIADLDHIDSIGTAEIKKLFGVNEHKIKIDVLENPKSKDAATLVQAIETAISNKNWDHAQYIWTYIKSSRTKIREDLTTEEAQQLLSFINEKKLDGIYLLKNGSLEDYLPDGFRGKDLERLILFLRNDSFWDELEQSAQEELKDIVVTIINQMSNVVGMEKSLVPDI
jgi:putative ATP-dependent endonuclease of the OLD family